MAMDTATARDVKLRHLLHEGADVEVVAEACVDAHCTQHKRQHNQHGQCANSICRPACARRSCTAGCAEMCPNHLEANQRTRPTGTDC